MGVVTNMSGEERNHMNGRVETNPSVSNIKPEVQTFQKVQMTRHQSCSHQSQSQGGVSHLLASASSPSLLSGCADSSTRAGACIEKHIHAHHVQVTDAPSLCQQTDAASNQTSFPSSPLPLTEEGEPPASLFLTSSTSSSRHSQGRPVSAPPHHLERISGMLLRLVGDHYLCTTCGRQLRGIGDELTLESSLRRILSSTDLGDIGRLSDR